MALGSTRLVAVLALVCAARAVKYSESIHCVRFLSITCPAQTDPYCATDDNTYGNGCLFQQARCRLEGQLSFKWRGTCEGGRPQTTTPSPCSPQYVCGVDPLAKPICGTDGKTYNNYCLYIKGRCLNPALKRQFFGRCEDGRPTTTTRKATSICDPDFRCSLEVAPLCGSDGKTYNNYCLFRQQVTCQKLPVSVDYNGPCSARTTPSQFANCMRNVQRCLVVIRDPRYAPSYGRPVCGTDRVLYRNYCEFQEASCNNPSLSITYPDRCPLQATTDPTVSTGDMATTEKPTAFPSPQA